MSKDQKLFSILEEIETRVDAMKRTEDQSYFEECYQEIASQLDKAFRLVGWEG